MLPTFTVNYYFEREQPIDFIVSGSINGTVKTTLPSIMGSREQTLKRQIEFNEYDLKDALINCTNLSDFYMGNQYYDQAEYILINVMLLLPEDLNKKKKKKIKSFNSKSIRKIILERLKFQLKLEE